MSEIISDDFYALFNNKWQMSAGGETYVLAVEWLSDRFDHDPKAYLQSIVACVIFAEKPKHFMITGQTKNTRKGDGNGADVRLASFLPQMAEDDYQAMLVSKNPQDIECRNARSLFPEEFKRINSTMISNIGLLVLETVIPTKLYFSKAVQQAAEKYTEIKPSEFTPNLDFYKQNEKSLEIASARFGKFRKYQSFWLPLIAQMSSTMNQARSAAQASTASSEVGMESSEGTNQGLKTGRLKGEKAK